MMLFIYQVLINNITKVEENIISGNEMFEMHN